MKTTYKASKAIVTFVLNHQHGLAIFRSNLKLDLLRVAKTRFASHYILLKRLSDCREALATTVVTKKWKRHSPSDLLAPRRSTVGAVPS
jgi:hypothetical protein